MIAYGWDLDALVLGIGEYHSTVYWLALISIPLVPAPRVAHLACCGMVDFFLATRKTGSRPSPQFGN